MNERSLAYSISFSGLGLYTGQSVEMRARPTPAGTRIIFRRVDLDNFENVTFTAMNPQEDSTLTEIVTPGDAATLTSNRYEPASSYNTAPYRNQRVRRIGRQLDFLKNRLQLVQGSDEGDFDFRPSVTVRQLESRNIP